MYVKINLNFKIKDALNRAKFDLNRPLLTV